MSLCQGPETEQAVVRESSGVSRVNHKLRVHGHTMLEVGVAAENFDDGGLGSLEPLFFCKRTTDVPRAAHLGVAGGSRQRIQSLIHDASTAGLLSQPGAGGRNGNHRLHRILGW